MWEGAELQLCNEIRNSCPYISWGSGAIKSFIHPPLPFKSTHKSRNINIWTGSAHQNFKPLPLPWCILHHMHTPFLSEKSFQFEGQQNKKQITYLDFYLPLHSSQLLYSKFRHKIIHNIIVYLFRRGLWTKIYVFRQVPTRNFHVKGPDDFKSEFWKQQRIQSNFYLLVQADRQTQQPQIPGDFNCEEVINVNFQIIQPTNQPIGLKFKRIMERRWHAWIWQLVRMMRK